MTDETAVADRGARPGVVSTLGALVELTKPKQTALLLVTAAGAYALSVPAGFEPATLAIGLAALAAAVSGCTALNMVLDRDIDARMERTKDRPLPSGSLPVRAAAVWGMGLSVAGTLAGLALLPAFGAIVAAGLAVDLGVYTAWLKRRSPYSIVLGGVAGGMPALAGRVLAIGYIDLIGILLACAIVAWIPAHILTLAIRHEDEYRAAGVPMWPVVFGAAATRRLVAGSSIGAAAVLIAAGVLLGTHPAALYALAVLGAGLVGLAVYAVARPSLEHDWLLFKAASIYMAAAFGCLVVGSAL